MRPIALITGATAGIGEATAVRFAQEGYRLVITGRREERLQQLKEQLERDYGIEVMSCCFDVRQPAEVKQQLEALPKEWKKISLLVNNAGLASGLAPLQKGEQDDWERMIDTNIKGVLYVTRQVVPWMIEQQQGHIINIASIAAKEVYPQGAVYCATKSAVDALTKGLRIDLLAEGIRVTQICPGAVETEFSLVRFHGDSSRAADVYKGFRPLVAEDIADCVFYAASRPTHVNISDMVVTPTAQATVMQIHKSGSQE